MVYVDKNETAINEGEFTIKKQQQIEPMKEIY